MRTASMKGFSENKVHGFAFIKMESNLKFNYSIMARRPLVQCGFKGKQNELHDAHYCLKQTGADKTREKEIIFAVSIEPTLICLKRVVEHSKAHCHNSILITSNILNERRRWKKRWTKQFIEEYVITSFNYSTMEQSAMFRSGNDWNGITLSTIEESELYCIIVHQLLLLLYSVRILYTTLHHFVANYESLEGIFFFNYDRYQYLI